jgi:hypothetical protein
MKFSPFLAAVFACTLSSCSSLPENTVTIDQYKAWEGAAPLKAREFRITAHIENEDGKVTPFGAVTANAGKEKVICLTKEFIYPDKFDLPLIVPVEEGQGDGSTYTFPVTPTTPTSFAVREVGDTLKISAMPKGAFVELSGSLTTITASRGIQSKAEAVSPISDFRKRYLFTYNSSMQPEFKTTESLIYSVGLVTSEHRMALTDGKRVLVVKCEVVR